MSKVSIIIPSRGEKFENLERTLESIYNNATGDFEVILGLQEGNNNYWPKVDYLNMTVISFPRNVGIKGNINTLALTATGKYLFKLDAHCAVGKGFDEILKADMQEDWIVMPRFKIIKEDWSIQMRDGQEEFYDYFYLCCPFTDPKGLRFKAGGHWAERTKERLYPNIGISDNKGRDSWFIDETPQIHGSGWFMTKDRYFELGGFPITDPYGHGQEPLWLGLRNWLMGGKVMVNKKTWYAHLHQNSKDRGYPEDKEHTERTYRVTAEYWLKHPNFEWFLEKFMPMPTWSENWRELLSDWRSKNA